MKIFKKLKFILRNPKVVVVPGEANFAATEKLFATLGGYRGFGRDTIVLKSDFREIFKVLLNKKNLILNSDDAGIKKMQEELTGQTLTYGFQEGAEFRVSDINRDDGINFKINYQGNTVPFWLPDGDNAQIYAVLAAAAVGRVLDVNLVELSQILSRQKR